MELTNNLEAISINCMSREISRETLREDQQGIRWRDQPIDMVRELNMVLQEGRINTTTACRRCAQNVNNINNITVRIHDRGIRTTNRCRQRNYREVHYQRGTMASESNTMPNYKLTACKPIPSARELCTKPQWNIAYLNRQRCKTNPTRGTGPALLVNIMKTREDSWTKWLPSDHVQIIYIPNFPAVNPYYDTSQATL